MGKINTGRHSATEAKPYYVVQVRREVTVLNNWLHSLDPSLLDHLRAHGIAPEMVEARRSEHCLGQLAYRHRLTEDVLHAETVGPRFTLLLDAK